MKTYDEHQIRCAINYAMENFFVLWPLNPRFQMQERVIEILKMFDRDVHELIDSGCIEKDIEKEVKE